MVEFFIGVDGGGTSTRAVAARVESDVLGRGEAGPSALGQGIAQAWRNVELAIGKAFEAACLPLPPRRACAIAAGLSGVNNLPWREAFLAANPGYAFVEAVADSYTMLLGAHGGKPGGIVAAGTGSIGEVLRADGTRATVGGWGFPVGDEGSGAWLGLQAMRYAQSAMDGRVNAGALAHYVWTQCGDDRDALQDWSLSAGQFSYAQLAPAVFEYERVDPAASELLGRAAFALESMALALDPTGRLPLALCGSVGRRLGPRMTPAVRARLVSPAAGPAVGALRLIRELMHKELEETT